MYIFVDESGRGDAKPGPLKTQPFFVVGVFVTSEPKLVKQMVDRVCDSKRFYSELHWARQGAFRCKVYRAVADELHKLDYWSFHVTFFEGSKINLSYFGGPRFRWRVCAAAIVTTPHIATTASRQTPQRRLKRRGRKGFCKGTQRRLSFAYHCECLTLIAFKKVASLSLIHRAGADFEEVCLFPYRAVISRT